MKRLAIIPARGGSKRIPRKNIKDFCGHPIIAYSIAAALDSGLFEEVMVSTDDAEIAETALKFGAKVPFLRSPETADDFATTAAVLEEVLLKYEELGQHFETACCLYPTAPLLKSESLKEAFALLSDKKYDSVFPVLKYSYHIWRSLKMENGNVSMNWPEHVNSRSQDLPPTFHDAGQFYFFRTEALLQQKTLFTDNSGAIELSELEVQDIDTLADWQMAEIKYRINLRSSFIIRYAKSDDLLLLFKFANDPEVRKRSFNTNPITIENHTHWFTTKLADESSVLYIVEINGMPAAHIRFALNGFTATISYLIAEGFRGKGLGHVVLLKGVQQLLKQHPKIKLIEGLVQQDNIASVRAFEKGGFAYGSLDPSHPTAYRFILEQNR